MVETRRTLRTEQVTYLAVEHRCEFCSRWFVPRRSDAQYCSDTCRVKAYNRRRKENRSES